MRAASLPLRTRAKDWAPWQSSVHPATADTLTTGTGRAKHEPLRSGCGSNNCINSGLCRSDTLNERLTSPSCIDTCVERETGFGWGWFIVLGAALVVLAVHSHSNLPPAGTVSVYAVGVVMVIGAFAQLGTTLLVPGWRGIGLLVLSAILYGAAGVFAIVNPRLVATPPTLSLAFALIFSGLMRIRLTSVMPSLPGWGWVAASGVVTVLFGLVSSDFLFTTTVWLLGMALAVDLTFQGAMGVAFGLALRATPTAIPPSLTEP